MSDPRAHPAHQSEQTPGTICVPVADLLRTPEGPRDRQLLAGDCVTILHREDQHLLVRSDKDGYHGYLAQAQVGAPIAATHHVTSRLTHGYRAADMKSGHRACLSFGSHVTAVHEEAFFVETIFGFVPRQHLHPVDARATDPAAVADVLLGTPYLWGGNSAFGIDCSGLVQAAMLACGLACPGDSDQQCDLLGETLDKDTPYKRNDLIFWRGHVALVTDPQTLIHANAGHMSTVYEPIDAAIERIANQGDGWPTAHKRIFSD